MSSAGPWSVKGIDPRARARAKTAARHDGVTLGEWLNRIILDDSDPANPSWDDALEGFPGFGGGSAAIDPGEDRLLRAMVNRLTERIEAAEHQSSQTLGSLDKAINQLVDKVGRSSERQSEQLDETREDLVRVRQGQDDLTSRIAQIESGHGTAGPETSKVIETTIMKLARRLYEHENDIAAQLHDTGQQVKDQGEAARKAAEALALKLERAEHRAADIADQAKRRDERSGEVLTGLHRATDSLRLRVEGAERQTNDAARTLDTTVSRLEDRLKMLETRNSGDNVELERRFDRLSGEVASIIAETRAQVATALTNVAAEPRVDRLETALTQALGRIDAAERRQGDGMHKLGHELTKLAGAIDRRLTESERRAQDSLRDARAEHNIDRRLDEVRQEGKASLRQMGDEVTRMGKALADRIANSEERTSSSVTAATDRMAEVIARLDEKKAASDEALADRLRQSEERTAQRIEDAMTGVHERLATARADTEDVLSPVQRAMSALADRLEAIEARKIDDEVKAEQEMQDAAAVPLPVPIDFDTPLSPPPQAETPRSHYAPEELDPFLAAEPEPLVAVPVHKPHVSAPTQPVPAPILRAREPAPTPQPQPQAQAPAPAQSQPQPAPPQRNVAAAIAPQPAISHPVRPAPLQSAPQPVVQPMPQAAPQPRPQRIGATADADFLAAARERTRQQSAMPDYDRGSRPSKFGRTLLFALPVVALVMLAGAGAILVWEAVRGDADTQAANAVQERSFVASVEAGFAADGAPATPTIPEAVPATSPAESDTASAQTDTASQSSPTQAPSQTPPTNAVADASGMTLPATPNAEPSRSAPQRSTAGTGSVTLEGAAADGNPVARYLLGMRSLEAGDAATGVILLRRAAEQGVPAAQYRYGKLLETGEGVAIDLEAARRWTERAANAGHRRAMHNLAVMNYYGTGTAVNFDEAARWFQEAALLGLRDSQFNLALLFESGQGVPDSLADAYTWYSIAASDTDPTAAQRATALEDRLEPEALAEARRTVAAFRPRPINPEANGLYHDLPWEQAPLADSNTIYRAQSFLAALGYSPGPVDGVIGGQTHDAIMAFEADQGLPQTGRIDAGLLDQLERAAAG